MQFIIKQNWNPKGIDVVYRKHFEMDGELCELREC